MLIKLWPLLIQIPALLSGWIAIKVGYSKSHLPYWMNIVIVLSPLLLCLGAGAIGLIMKSRMEKFSALTNILAIANLVEFVMFGLFLLALYAIGNRNGL